MIHTPESIVMSWKLVRYTVTITERQITRLIATYSASLCILGIPPRTAGCYIPYPDVRHVPGLWILCQKTASQLKPAKSLRDQAVLQVKRVGLMMEGQNINVENRLLEKLLNNVWCGWRSRWQSSDLHSYELWCLFRIMMMTNDTLMYRICTFRLSNLSVLCLIIKHVESVVKKKKDCMLCPIISWVSFSCLSIRCLQ